MTDPDARPSGSGHVVFRAADNDAFTSLRRRSSTRAERKALGRELRQQVDRAAPRRLGTRARPASDVIEQIRQSHEGRLDWLIPVRVARMAASPYGFLRGTAVVMADDLAQLPVDRHHAGDLRRRAPRQLRLLRLAGARAGDRPERLRRGAPRRVGVGPAPARRQHLGGRPAELRDRERCASDAVLSCVATYREHVRWLAEQPLLSRAFERLDVDRLEREHRRTARCGTRSRGPPGAPAPGPATGRCRASPRSGPRAGGSSRSRR